MNRLTTAVALISTLLLSACGSDKSEDLVLDTLRTKAKTSLGPKQVASVPVQAFTRAQLQTVGAPVIQIAIPSTSAIALMAQLTANKGTQTFASPDGSMLTYRSGVLISTRGIVGGLMSASVPSAATLAKPGSSYERVHYVLGDNDAITPIVYACTTAFVGTETVEIFQKRHTVRHMRESCQGSVGQIANDYWFEGGSKIRMSRQWATPTLSYFETKSVID